MSKIPSVCNAFLRTSALPVKPDLIEQVAVEVLGWERPDDS